MENVNIQVIARMRSDFATKFGIPRQSGLVEELRSTIVFEPEFRNPDALRGIADFSHLWIIWQFSEAVRSGWSPTVRPPRLGGNTRMGVFATRSPFRPNNLGLSSVKLLGWSIRRNSAPCFMWAGPISWTALQFLTSSPTFPTVTAIRKPQEALRTQRVNSYLRWTFPLPCWNSFRRTSGPLP